MTLRLHTFGVLELLDEDGNVLAGAASQAKPLLILALAALHPAGISRARLVRALWPGVPTDRAKATLKQHLYSLRRATSDPDLITGTPMLRVAAGRLAVDALELEDAVGRGDLRQASTMVQGELLAEVDTGSGGELAVLVGELRARFAPALALVSAAGQLRDRIGAHRAVPISLDVLGVGRELDEAVRSALRNWRTLPDDRLAAEFRVSAVLYQLAEALRSGEQAGIPDQELQRMVDPLRRVLAAVEPLARFLEPAGHAPPDPVALVDWALAGRTLTTNALGRALESALLASPIGSQLRARARWSGAVVREQIGTAAAPLGRILAIDCRWWSRYPPLRAEEWPSGTDLVTIGPVFDEGLFGAARLTEVASDDPWLDVLSLDRDERFDLIVVGAMLDGRDFRELGRELGAVSTLLSPGGSLVFDLASDRSWCEVARHLLGIDWRATDLESLTVLAGRLAGGAVPIIERAPDGGRWQAVVAAGASDPAADEPRVASVGIAEL
ncbi:MAG TPA: hypothetical protein PLL69_03025 [Gemmatimonadales bacterium]|nr:hypothetical protein [Gemmatimonadales bacterium]